MAEGAHDMIQVGQGRGEDATESGEGMALEQQDQGSQELDRIRARIEHTEAKLEETLEAIQEKLSFDYIMKQAEEKLLGTTITEAEEMMKRAGEAAGRIGNSVAETFKEYPIPITLMGVGLTWLLYKGVSGYREEISTVSSPEEGGDVEEVSEALYQAGLEEPGGSEYREGGALASSGVMRAALNTVRGVAENVQEKTRDIAMGAIEKGRNLRSEAAQSGEWDRGGIRRTLRDNAFAIGIAAIGVGAVVGLLVPETRREREIMGESRESVLRQARALGEKAVGQARGLLRRAHEEHAAMVEEAAEGIDASAGETLPPPREAVEYGSGVH